MENNNETMTLAEENAALRARVEELTRAQREARSTGSRVSAGGGAQYDAFDAGWDAM